MTSRGVVLREVKGRLEAYFQFASGGTTPARGAATIAAPLSLGTLLGIALLVLAVLLLTAVLSGSMEAGGLLLANGAVATKKGLKQIVEELKKLQEEYKGKPMPEDVGKQFDELAAEAKQLQDEADREKQLKNIERFAAEVPDPALPAGTKAADERKKEEDAAEIAGYISVGALFTSSDVFREYVKAGAREGVITPPVAIKGMRGRYVPLTREMRQAVTKALRETKAIPTIGAGVIEPQRIDELVRVTERDQLRLRDLLNVSQTTQQAVEWVEITDYTRAAAPVAETAAKPEAGMEVDVRNTPVRTIAVWMPVTEQQLQDAPQVTNMIDSELLFDLDKAEEEEIMYGDATGQHFDGILHHAGVLAGRTVAGDTNLDKIRRAITDVRRAGYAPNGVAIDPLDWEGIVLLKGTDNRYVWSVVTDDDGDRVWGLRVVETIGVEANAGDTTEERNIVVGDWIRGATLWDRMQAAVMVGWINDQFIKNMRTIRAEKRAAFAVRRPRAFRKIETVAAVA